ncbi:hypothetical protein Tco_1066093, partial [Tanacetum coccineum]
MYSQAVEVSLLRLESDDDRDMPLWFRVGDVGDLPGGSCWKEVSGAHINDKLAMKEFAYVDIVRDVLYTWVPVIMLGSLMSPFELRDANRIGGGRGDGVGGWGAPWIVDMEFNGGIVGKVLKGGGDFWFSWGVGGAANNSLVGVMTGEVGASVGNGDLDAQGWELLVGVVSKGVVYCGTFLVSLKNREYWIDCLVAGQRVWVVGWWFGAGFGGSATGPMAYASPVGRTGDPVPSPTQITLVK